MINAIALSLLLATSPVAEVPISPAIVQAPTWALDGHLLWNFEDGAPVLGVTYTPDVEFPLGITVLVTRIKWDADVSETTKLLRYHHPPLVSTRTWTEERDDVRVFAGVTWRFR